MLLVDHLQIRKQWVMDNFEIFLGATVADAAARPLHWIYDSKKLKKYIKGKKEIAFLKKNQSQIGRAHVRTPVTSQSRMPSSA